MIHDLPWIAQVIKPFVLHILVSTHKTVCPLTPWRVPPTVKYPQQFGSACYSLLWPVVATHLQHEERLFQWKCWTYLDLHGHPIWTRPAESQLPLSLLILNLAEWPRQPPPPYTTIELDTNLREVWGFTITKKAPSRDLSWLKVTVSCAA